MVTINWFSFIYVVCTFHWSIILLLHKLNTNFHCGFFSHFIAHSTESRGANISYRCLSQELLLTHYHQQQDFVFCSLQTPSIPIDFKVNCKYISASDKAPGCSQQHQLRVEMLRYQTWLWIQDLPRVLNGAGHPSWATSKGPKWLVQRNPQGRYPSLKMLYLMEIFSHPSLDTLPGDFIQFRDMG